MEYLLVGVILPLIVTGIQGATVPNLNPNTKLVVFSFDGFRFDYLEKGFGPDMIPAEAPTLRKLRADGVTTPYMIPQFTSKTFPNHQSISTGLFPENHGIIENSVYDIELEKEVNGYQDHTDFWVYNKEVLPIWVLNEMAGNGRISGAQFPGSTQIYGTENHKITFPMQYDGDLPFRDRMDITIQWLTNSTNPANLIFMYFEEPDSQGHDYGPNSLQVLAAIEDLDKMTAYFLDELSRLEISDLVNIIILSDHGMEEVKQKNKVSLTGLIDSSLNYTWRGGSPVLQIWPDNEAETEVIYEAFLNASQERPFNVFRKGNLPAYWHYNNERRVPPILIEADPGFSFDEKWVAAEDVHLGKTVDEPIDPEATEGYHGYDATTANMGAFFMAIGPNFTRKAHVDPFQNVDLFPLMCRLLRINTPPNDGNDLLLRNILVSNVVDEGNVGGNETRNVYIKNNVTIYVDSYTGGDIKPIINVTLDSSAFRREISMLLITLTISFSSWILV